MPRLHHQDRSIHYTPDLNQRKRQPVPAAVDFRLAAAVFAPRRRRATTSLRRLAASSAMSSGL